MILTDDIMYEALIKKDASFEGQFFVAVKTTGIFCRPSCAARKPKKENVIFFTTAKECMMNGFRPCRVCHPLRQLYAVPEPVKDIMEQLASHPDQKIKDEDLRLKGIEPSGMRRWFLKQYGITFQAYQRMLRMAHAAEQIKAGSTVTGTAYDAGFESLSGFGTSFKNAFGVSPSGGKHQKIMYVDYISTPIGKMIAAAVDEGICLLEFLEQPKLNSTLQTLAQQLDAKPVQGNHAHLKQLEQELGGYFSKKIKSFEVPLCIYGTSFQKLVWQGLRTIPYGETRSYLQQAIALKKPDSVRAVANANGKNRIAILIPCHRVIGNDGKLTGYAGGIWRKKFLLDLEQQSVHESA